MSGWLSECLDTHGKFVRLNRHKVYHCSNGRDIDVDVSIDVYATQEFMDEDRPTQTYIYECKNLRHKLNIADYDEWRGKLGDLGKTGHKLFIVCRKRILEADHKICRRRTCWADKISV